MFRTTLLLGLLTGLFLGVGYLLGGVGGTTIALFLALILNFLAYWFSDKIVLSMYNAKPVSEKENPSIHSIVKRVADAAGIPKPAIYIIKEGVPNAFATGRNNKHAVVAVTSGLMSMLNEHEIEGVIAHEVSHIKNNDILISTMAATIAGAISYLGQMVYFGMNRERNNNNIVGLIVMMIFAPIAAVLIQMTISRSREYGADRTGAMLTKKPSYLASALEKISDSVRQHPMQGSAATSHLWIVNPFRGDVFASMFSTHPPVTERVRKLREMKI